MSSARDLCTQINQIQAKLTPLLPQLKAQSKTQDDFIVAILTAANLSPAQIQSYRGQAQTNTASTATNLSSIIQSNTVDTEECAQLLGCKNIKDPVYRAKLTALLNGDAVAAQKQIDLLQQMCTFDVTQSNVSSTEQTYQQTISTSIDQFSKLPFDPVVQGIINALSGGNLVNCNSLSASTPSVALQQAYQSCLQHAELNLGNVANCASANQSNSVNLLQSCVMKSATQVTPDTDNAAGQTPINSNTTLPVTPFMTNNQNQAPVKASTRNEVLDVVLFSTGLLVICTLVYKLI